MIGKLGTRAWKLTILIRFYTGFYTIFLWVVDSDFRIPPQSAALPSDNDFVTDFAEPIFLRFLIQ